MLVKMDLSQGTIYGARYWTVKPAISWDVNGDWGNIRSWQEMLEWCVETFGPTPEDGVWTPGAHGIAIMQSFGLETKQIEQCLY